VMLPMTPTQPFDHLVGLDKTPSLSAQGSMGDPFPPLQFATAVRINFNTVLVAGGLEVLPNLTSMGSAAVNPPKDNGGLYKIGVSGTNPLMVTKVVAGGSYKFDPACAMPGRYKPVAWNAATLITSPLTTKTVPVGATQPPERVLLTGGTARNVVGNCRDCDNNDDKLACVLGQTSIYTVADNKIQPVTVESMLIPRYGHTQSLLPDGKVILIGGYTRNSQQTLAVPAPEVWNPARRAPPPVDDKDDPAYLDLQTLRLKREPGGQAYCASDGSKAPAITCDAPGRLMPQMMCN
jgi:hypothetical protein